VTGAKQFGYGFIVDGTSLREEAGVKGKPANGVSTQLMKRERQFTAGPALLPTTRQYVHFDS
jgi:hypothetical protein